ncbi:acetylcholine receptor subunit alpha-type acr-16-like [Chelonus insularis]|uniref:acetylcholine receptor subunit alpha-type acr-16-like n=1 Tax=Chelonus insularis TaxID=460826 RepID=UPI00158C133B|nr:acetylcholine receptor subunit alpha-type acr-16-like [Chelonus insularis]
MNQLCMKIKEHCALRTYFNCIMFMVASSVVLTVLVLNYHHRTADNHEMSQWIKSVLLQWLPWMLRMTRPGRKITRKKIIENSKIRELERKNQGSQSLIANVVDLNDDLLLRFPVSTYPRTPGHHPSGRPPTIEETTTFMPLNGTQVELQNILRELQFITQHMKKTEMEAEIISDWKFAAMVVDRLCLIVFTLFTVIATIAVLFSAPHIIVQ